MDIDWESLFLPDTSVLEIILRGTVIYLALFILLRVILKRVAGTVSITDLLVIVLIADASQNGMAGDYTSITDGLILVATLIFWNFALEWLSYKIPQFEKLVHPSALLLIKEGRILHANMREELVTKIELMSRLREQGIQDIRKVKAARMEGDGQISVITFDEKQEKSSKKQKAT